ncbi:MAG: lipid-A-disaccharide synthase [Candidatus Latescibacterota bacterium]|nr:MAG: lipid-A-disaccharide synthase [Candidatus Latescibacterota bacterium]
MGRKATILITCGEASGDMHAATLVGELRKRLPDANVVALGGERVAQAGGDLLYHIEDYAIIGFSGVLTKLPRLLRLEKGLKRVLEGGIDLFIPVDYPGLNLRLAAHAKNAGVPVLYYISPQVWAWGRGRVEKLARAVDYMAVILPFEEGFFQSRGIPAEFVGHPLVEDHSLPEPVGVGERNGIGLLPGSRRSEVRRILPIFLAAAEEIRRHDGNVRFTIGRSPSVPKRIYQKIVSRHSVDVDINGKTPDVMAHSRLLLVASGTATLQGALLETPLIIAYRLSMFNYLIARRLVKISNIGLVNIILGEAVCPEYVQAHAKPRLIAREAIGLLQSKEDREAMVAKFKGLRKLLSGKGGCRRVAEISEQLLNHS